MTLDLDELESKAKAAGGDEWFASGNGLSVNATNAKIRGKKPICDIRGWGYLTGEGYGALGLSEKEAIAVQRAIADYIASANPATILALVARIRELEADNKDFLDQISAQTESVLYKELQEALARNNALFAENEALKAQLKQEQEDGSEMLMIAYLDGASKARALADKRRAENEALIARIRGLEEENEALRAMKGQADGNF